jgi:hypothetical protein
MVKKKKRRERRRFTPEFKAEAVRLVEVGSKSIPQVARELDLTASPLRVGHEKLRYGWDVHAAYQHRPQRLRPQWASQTRSRVSRPWCVKSFVFPAVLRLPVLCQANSALRDPPALRF